MNQLTNLSACKTLKDLAKLLGYPAKNFAYVLFSSPIHTCYETFIIPKKSGGSRIIHAPKTALKEIQKALANLLNSCFDIIEKQRLNLTNKHNCILSHAFRNKLTLDHPVSNSITKKSHSTTHTFGIYSNAAQHTKKKFILNIDLKDFFTTITFKRIVGFFTNNNHFKLHKDIAILIAQIATYRDSKSNQGFLPQGSPCSPIISNLIGGILDNSLNKLANANKCTYTRFADDITFSTNISNFPLNLAEELNSKYTLAKPLINIIKKNGFHINPSKTRLTINTNQQKVTGLVVNKKVNISSNYYRSTRSMVHSYCKTGKFYKSNFHSKPNISSPNSLSGITNHIFNIRKLEYLHSKSFRKFSELDSLEKLIIRFQTHKDLIHNSRPTVVCEGITDPMHFKNAYKMIHSSNNFPFRFETILSFKKLVKIQGFGNGTGQLKHLLNLLEKINKSEIKNPNACIIFVDGDDAGKGVLSAAKKLYPSHKELNFSYFHISLNDYKVINLHNNLYVVSLPESITIESLYDPSLLNTKLGNRTLSLGNKPLDYSKNYGKKDFFEQVVKPRSKTIDFSKFKPIFEILTNVQIYNFLSSQC